MISHLVLTILSDPEKLPATSAQRALRLFADYDLSVPRLLNCGLLDKRYGWLPGTSHKLLGRLEWIGILTLVRGKASKPSQGPGLWMLAPGMGWTPKMLAKQWESMQAASQRASVGLSQATSATP
jgi:hypothetical protein